MLACLHGGLQHVQVLLKAGTDVNQHSKVCNSTLSEVYLYCQHYGILRVFIDM